jgi:hypothetical protein
MVAMFKSSQDPACRVQCAPFTAEVMFPNSDDSPTLRAQLAGHGAISGSIAL